MNFVFIFFFTVLNVFLVSVSIAQTNQVHVSGAMRNVMMKGELQATIFLDTIRPKQHLYGIGPLEYLQGEILVRDGKAYKATVADDSSISMEKTFDLRAPFFVYANIDRWKEYSLPDSVHSLFELDSFLNRISIGRQRPFVFKLAGKIVEVKAHLVNLPPSTKVKAPADTHQGQHDFTLKQEVVEMIGFFSTQHKGIFTHHDSNVHVHIISADEKVMGHLDAVDIDAAKIKLYLSEWSVLGK